MEIFNNPAVIISLLGICAALIVFIYLDDRSTNKKKFEGHEVRLDSLEREISDIRVMRRDIQHIKEAVDEMKRYREMERKSNA